MARRFEVINNDLICENTGEVCPAKVLIDQVYTSADIGFDGQPVDYEVIDLRKRSAELHTIDAIAMDHDCADGCAAQARIESVGRHPSTGAKLKMKIGKLASKFLGNDH